MKKAHFDIKRHSRVLIISFITLVFLFLLANIIQSQKILLFYNGLIYDDKKNVVKFLKNIKTLPEYQQILSANADIFGQDLKNEVIEDDIKRKEMINKLYILLQKNPKSRDVLYGLYLLNKEAGNSTLANRFLNKAKKIDPNLK